MTWLSEITAALAGACGLDAARYTLDEGDAATLLELAALAAHESGERTNAPLLCHVVGMMRADGAPLGSLAAAAHSRLGTDGTA
jgi:hypothetical protein